MGMGAATGTATARVLRILDGLGIARALHNEAKLVEQFGLEVDLEIREYSFSRAEQATFQFSSTCRVYYETDMPSKRVSRECVACI